MKKVILIAISILVLAGIGYTGYLFLGFQESEWKIYESREYGYSFKYPAEDYVLRDTSRTPIGITYKTHKYFKESKMLTGSTQINGASKTKTLFWIEIWENPLNLSLRDWINWAWPKNQGIFMTEDIDKFYEVVINEMQGLRYTKIKPKTDSAYEPYSDVLGTNVILQKSNKVFALSFSEYGIVTNFRDKNVKILEAILQSLRIE